MLFDGILADFLAGQKREQRFIRSQIMKDGLSEDHPKFTDGQNQQPADTFAKDLGLGQIGAQLADVLEILMVEVFGVQSLEVVHEDIKYFYFLLSLEERVEGSVTFLFTTDVGINIIDQVQLSVLF